MQNIEIEFKALLTKDVYEEILSNACDVEKFKQVNHYFETENDTLKNNKMALRVRVKDSCNKITVKCLMDSDKVLYNEVSDFLGLCETRNMIENRTIESKIIIDYLNENGIEDVHFPKYNVFTTNRAVCHYDNHVLFLDETIYENGEVDYELEIESENYEDCKNSFFNYAQKYNLENSNVHKIERAIVNSK